MSIRYLAIAATIAVLSLSSGAACALTMDQFASICDSGQEDCSKHPLLHAYVGGALDLIAVLDEETDYLARVYCKKPADLFDVPTVIRYMEQRREAYANRNAMLLVVRYLEEEGGC